VIGGRGLILLWGGSGRDGRAAMLTTEGGGGGHCRQGVVPSPSSRDGGDGCLCQGGVPSFIEGGGDGRCLQGFVPSFVEGGGAAVVVGALSPPPSSVVRALSPPPSSREGAPTYLTRQVPSSWHMSNGVFHTKGRGKLPIKFFEYSNSKEFLVSDVFENDKKMGKPAFDLIIGCNSQLNGEIRHCHEF
jgi:hypothetical protein